MRKGDGMARLVKRVEYQVWPCTDAAEVWVEAFCREHPEVDREEMLGWFANAMMAGYEAAEIHRTTRHARQMGGHEA